MGGCQRSNKDTYVYIHTRVYNLMNKRRLYEECTDICVYGVGVAPGVEQLVSGLKRKPQPKQGGVCVSLIVREHVGGENTATG